MDSNHQMFNKGWISVAAPTVATALINGEVKPFPSKSKRPSKKLEERRRIIKAMSAIYQRNKRKHKQESNDEVFEEASKQVINHEAQALANKQRTPVQIWFDKNKARVYRAIIFLVTWFIGSLITAIVIMPFSISAGSNFILLAIFGLIEAMSCTAFYREYTIQKRYDKLDQNIQQQCAYFHLQVRTQLHNKIQQRKKRQQNEQRSF